jgi:hypothetical protein
LIKGLLEIQPLICSIAEGSQKAGYNNILQLNRKIKMSMYDTEEMLGNYWKETKTTKKESQMQVVRKVGELANSTKTKIIVSIVDIKGVERIDIRTNFMAESGEWFPTKKGVTIPMAQKDEFRDLINNI